MPSASTKIEHAVSVRSLLTVFLFGIGLLVAWKLVDVLFLVLLALMLAAALEPAVIWLHKFFPLPAAAVIVVIALVLPVVGIIVGIVPQLVVQIPNIVEAIKNGLHGLPYISRMVNGIDFSQYYQNGQYLWESTAKLTLALRNFIALFVLTLYFLIDADRLHALIVSFIARSKRKAAEKASRQVARISGQYIRGNLLISLICSVLIYIGLLALHVPYALPLAVFAGILDLLPLFGAVIGAFPAVLLAFIVSPLTGLLTVILFMVYQQLENAVLAPNIYNKALDLAPSLSFLSVIVGGSLFGIPGAFLSLPIAASIPALVKYFKDI